MKQKTIILSIVVAAIFIGCNNDQGKKVQINPLDELEQVDNLLSEIAEKPQQLTAPSDKKATVAGAKGTVIHVDPNLLETVDGSPLGDNIQIELLEMTDYLSMLLNNTQTVSNGQILVTGGAYYINMTSNGKQLKMKRGKGLEIEFPKLTDDEMGLFLGERDSLGQINWKENEQKFESSDTDKTRNISIPMPTGYPSVTDTLAHNSMTEKERETYKAVEIMNFGWINCDRFLNDPTPKRNIELIVTNDTISGARFYAVFEDINSIMTEYYYRDYRPAFKNIPEGRQLKIFALSVIDDKPYFFETSVNTSIDKQVQVTFSESTHADIKKKIKRLN